jgi:hypothetical protein
MSSGTPPLRLQELTTLMKACHMNVAQPWTFLEVLVRVVFAQPHILTSWSTSEQEELGRAYALYIEHTGGGPGSSGGGSPLASAPWLLNRHLANRLHAYLLALGQVPTHEPGSVPLLHSPRMQQPPPPTSPRPPPSPSSHVVHGYSALSQQVWNGYGSNVSLNQWFGGVQ